MAKQKQNSDAAPATAKKEAFTPKPSPSIPPVPAMEQPPDRPSLVTATLPLPTPTKMAPSEPYPPPKPKKTSSAIVIETPLRSGATDHVAEPTTKTDEAAAILIQSNSSPREAFDGAAYNSGSLHIVVKRCEAVANTGITCEGWALNTDTEPQELAFKEASSKLGRGLAVDNAGNTATISLGNIVFGSLHQMTLFTGHPANFRFTFDDPSRGRCKNVHIVLSIRWKGIYGPAELSGEIPIT